MALWPNNIPKSVPLGRIIFDFIAGLHAVMGQEALLSDQ